LLMSRNVFRNLPIVGVEDGSFQKGIARKTLLVAVLFKGLEIEDAKFTKITVDGLDATEKLYGLLSEWEFAAVLLAGVSFAGFNIIDPAVIHGKFKKSVIIATRTKPDNKAVHRALQKHFKDWRIRWGVFEKMGAFHKVASLADEPPIYVETIGADARWTYNLIHALSVCCRVPEPIRIARLIARGLS
jgi:endonuclease V-like protein UPF0215 family